MEIYPIYRALHSIKEFEMLTSNIKFHKPM